MSDNIINKFNRIREYLKNYIKIQPLTYEGFQFIPYADATLSGFKGNVDVTAILTLLSEDPNSVDKSLLRKLYKLSQDPKETKTKVENYIKTRFLDDTRIKDILNKLAKISIIETAKIGKSPSNVPHYITDVYFNDANKNYLRYLNDVLKSLTIRPYNPYNSRLVDFLATTKQGFVDSTKNIYQNYTPEQLRIMNQHNLIPKQHIDLFEQYGEDDFINYITLKTSQVNPETETYDDLHNSARFSTESNSNINQKLPSEGVFGRNKIKQPINNLKCRLQESFKNNEDLIQLQCEKPMTSQGLTQGGNNWNFNKILGATAGITLLGGGAYAAYKWWQYKKQQEEQRQKQLRELERKMAYDEHQKNKSKKQTYINIIGTPDSNLNI